MSTKTVGYGPVDGLLLLASPEPERSEQERSDRVVRENGK